MKAAVYYDKGDLRVEDVPEPIAKPNQALISVEWSGICGSDLTEYIAGPGFIPKEGSPHPLTGETLPVTMGHEFCGRIKQAPKGSKLKVGQAVMVDPRSIDGTCNQCKMGATHACEVLACLGIHGGGGGFSEVCAVEEAYCYPIPEELLPNAALIEPLAVAWHAIKVPGWSSYKGKTVLIVGGGPIGIALVFALRHWGAGRIFVSEPAAMRRKQNEELADEVFDPLKVKIVDVCRARTDGAGVDIVFDAAGTPAGLADGMAALKYRGTYLNVATWKTPLIIPFYEFMMKELNIASSIIYNEVDFKETVDAFSSGKFKGVEKMVTDRVYLDDIKEKGFEALIKRTETQIKILVTPKQGLLG